jgi:hypothetical protein
LAKEFEKDLFEPFSAFPGDMPGKLNDTAMNVKQQSSMRIGTREVWQEIANAAMTVDTGVE